MPIFLLLLLLVHWLVGGGDGGPERSIESSRCQIGVAFRHFHLNFWARALRIHVSLWHIELQSTIRHKYIIWIIIKIIYIQEPLKMPHRTYIMIIYIYICNTYHINLMLKLQLDVCLAKYMCTLHWANCGSWANVTAASVARIHAIYSYTHFLLLLLSLLFHYNNVVITLLKEISFALAISSS